MILTTRHINMKQHLPYELRMRRVDGLVIEADVSFKHTARNFRGLDWRPSQITERVTAKW